MNDIYLTITGFNHYHGLKVFKIGKLVKLVKEPDNNYDDENITVELRYAGKVGNVANSVKTVARGTMSAGRLYDKIQNEDYAYIKFITDTCIIAKLLDDNELFEELNDKESDIHYI
ncbi:MAG: hypothetical protein BZ136_00145 [Methanosphaera sp. rholeuAM74]|nr:MAG: hypothetical protein BZ136_00145 [Methanosphaera sp. rholeuAM74]